MPKLIKLTAEGPAWADDRFTNVADDEPVPEGDVIVSLTRFQAEGEALQAHGRDVGVRIEPSEEVETLAYDLPRIPVVALRLPEIPRWARVSAPLHAAARQRLGYAGEGWGRWATSCASRGPPSWSAAASTLSSQPTARRPRRGTGPRTDSVTSTSAPPTTARQRSRSGPKRPGRRPMPYEGAESLETIAELNARLRDASPQEILAAAMQRLGDGLALVSSFGSESAVLLHMAAQINPDIPVLFLDTGMLFGQTLDYRKALAQRLGLTGVRDLRPQYQDLAVHDPSANLWQTDTDGCCRIRKVLPLERALAEFDGWITGRKRFQGGDRLRLKVVEETEEQAEVQAPWPTGPRNRSTPMRSSMTSSAPAGRVRLSVDPDAGLAPEEPVEEVRDTRGGPPGPAMDRRPSAASIWGVGMHQSRSAGISRACATGTGYPVPSWSFQAGGGDENPGSPPTHGQVRRPSHWSQQVIVSGAGRWAGFEVGPGGGRQRAAVRPG